MQVDQNAGTLGYSLVWSMTNAHVIVGRLFMHSDSLALYALAAHRSLPHPSSLFRPAMPSDSSISGLCSDFEEQYVWKTHKGEALTVVVFPGWARAPPRCLAQ
jgi:hypothetical protein